MNSLGACAVFGMVDEATGAVALAASRDPGATLRKYRHAWGRRGRSVADGVSFVVFLPDEVRARRAVDAIVRSGQASGLASGIWFDAGGGMDGVEDLADILERAIGMEARRQACETMDCAKLLARASAAMRWAEEGLR